ncbi:MAG: nicotinamide-nucleotide amidohydrolase family protein [Lentisphaeria bacterium]|nr:nicotinamide-nucleotide amidohydrolase family protein [Lentisphaeria bacterium]
MSIAVICIGTELLKGGCCNTNMQFLGAKLTELALPPVMELSIGDHPDELCFALGCALKTADTLIISGGLGPTADDITLETVAAFFGLELVIVPELKEKVEKRWAMRHSGHCPKFQYKQAMVPADGRYFDNPAGTASGIGFETVYAGKMRRIYILPGPPAEFETVLNSGILCELEKTAGEKLYTTGFLICGAGEAFVEKHAKNLFGELDIELAYTAVPGGTKIFFSGKNPDLVNGTAKKAQEFFGKTALGPGCFDLPAILLKKLRAKNFTFGCAESCTGGICADTVVSIPGASDIFKGGIISYANSAKEDILGVNEDLLKNYGAVSSQCAEAMAQGACKALKCNCSISTTGIAGPGGGTPEKPVGLVYIAACVNGLTAVKELRLHGSRKMIRERAAANAFYLLYELLDAPENAQC